MINLTVNISKTLNCVRITWSHRVNWMSSLCKWLDSFHRFWGSFLVGQNKVKMYKLVDTSKSQPEYFKVLNNRAARLFFPTNTLLFGPTQLINFRKSAYQHVYLAPYFTFSFTMLFICFIIITSIRYCYVFSFFY